MKWILAILALAACGQRDGGGANPCDDLAAIVEKAAIARVPADASAAAKEIAGEIGQRSGAMIVTRCREDRWSSDMIDCAKTATDFDGCKPKLTADQQMKLEDATKQLGGVINPPP